MYYCITALYYCITVILYDCMTSNFLCRPPRGRAHKGRTKPKTKLFYENAQSPVSAQASAQACSRRRRVWRGVRGLWGEVSGVLFRGGGSEEVNAQAQRTKPAHKAQRTSLTHKPAHKPAHKAKRTKQRTRQTGSAQGFFSITYSSSKIAKSILSLRFLSSKIAKSIV